MRVGTDEAEKIARSIAFWHGQKIIGRDREGQTETIASRRGFGLWGHSAENYSHAHWREYTSAAEAEIARTAKIVAEERLRGAALSRKVLSRRRQGRMSTALKAAKV